MSTGKPPAAALMVSPDDIETQFYEALQAADIHKLMAVWSDDDDIVCVLPGGPRVVGPRAIRASFEAVFANGGVPVRLERVRRLVQGSAAVHHLLVRVDVNTDEGTQTAWVIVTNVYLKTDQGWRLVAHHASPGTDRELLEVGEVPSVLH
ncbi:MAG: nuclear transport factor 2 family protein [Pseudomonadota bacterium]